MSGIDTNIAAGPHATKDAAVEPAEVVVALKDITVQFGNYTAVQDVSFEVPTGNFLSIVGPSGCGKSTLLNLVSGLSTPATGSVRNAILERGERMGYMFQRDLLLDWRNVVQNVALGLEAQGESRRAARQKARDLLPAYGLEGFESFYPCQLSGGMRQRAAFARTMSADPPLLLLDEPFSALDYQTKLKLEGELLAPFRRSGGTAIMVTHDIDEAVAVSDVVLVMTGRPGRVAAIHQVPFAASGLAPFEVRDAEGFGHYVRDIWREIES
jgi:NitT/TauT family transport system ATP-binding protein